MEKSNEDLAKTVVSMQQLWAKRSPDGCAPTVYFSYLELSDKIRPRTRSRSRSICALEVTSDLGQHDPLPLGPNTASYSGMRMIEPSLSVSLGKVKLGFVRSLLSASKIFASPHFSDFRPQRNLSSQNGIGSSSGPACSTSRLLCVQSKSGQTESNVPTVLSSTVGNEGSTEKKTKFIEALHNFGTILYRPVSVWDIKNLASQLQTCRVLGKNELPLFTAVQSHSNEETPLVGTNSETSQGVVLLVDDESSILKFTARMLEKNGFLVVTQSNGMEGLNSLKQQQFDAALIDLNMPVMDGLECVRRFRKWEKQMLKIGKRQHSQFIAILSANSHEISQDPDTGANKVISKPVKIKYLVETILAPNLTSQQPFQKVERPGPKHGLILKIRPVTT